MPYNPNIAIHPGKIILRCLEDEGMTQKNLSERTGLTEKHISQIINGEASITVETALLLENALSGSASFWINLEKNYQETKARIERIVLIKKEIPLLKKYPYLELAKRGMVEQTKNLEKKVENLWKFFGVNSLEFVQTTEAVAYRLRTDTKIKSEYIATWLRCGELEAKKCYFPEFSETKLTQSLEKLKSITLKSVENFSEEAKEILGEAGVTLVYVKHFTGSGASGAVRWIGNSPVIQLSLLWSYADIFWFNLFHEIGHLLLHGKKDKFIEFDKPNNSEKEEKEKEADSFATNNLINQKLYNMFTEKGDYSKKEIIKFSREIGIHPGIVAGRLSHEGKIKWSEANGLRSRLKFTN